MQNNWMRQRAVAKENMSVDDQPVHNNVKRGQNSTRKATKAMPDSETVTWVVGGGQSKKIRSSSMRSRSASPGRNQTRQPEKRKVGQPQTSSGKMTCGSSPTSSRSDGQSRPPSGRSVKHCKDAAKESSSAIIGSETYQNNNHLLDRSLSETDLKQAFQKVRLDVSHLSNGHPERSSMQIQTNQSEMCNHKNNQSENSITGLLEPNQFDNLADQLSQKVKAQILEEQQKSLLVLGVTHDSIMLDEIDSRQPSYSCSKCKQIMVPPDHIPTLLVPCGHTFCEPCAEDRIKCPKCRTKVTSTTINESLQKIIVAGKTTERLKDNKPPSEMNLSHPETRELSKERIYNPSDYSDFTNKQDNIDTGRNSNVMEYVSHLSSEYRSTFTPLKKHTDQMVQSERYVEEYESLCIRSEAYENEEEDILIRVEKKNQEIEKQKKQISNIGHEQQRIREEIKHLEEKLTVLTSHQEEFKRQQDALEEIKLEDMTQLKTVRETKKNLQKQREKIKYLARNVGISLEDG